MAQKWPEGGSL